MIELHNIVFTRGDKSEYVQCDKMAVSMGGYEVHAMSLIGTSSQIKAVRAMIYLAKKHYVSVRLNHQSYSLPRESECTIATCKLPNYDMWHLTFRSKAPEFYIGTNESVAAEFLLSDRINTPILPEWIPAISDELVKLKSWHTLNVHGDIEAYWVATQSSAVDRIVSALLSENRISIASNLAAVCP